MTVGRSVTGLDPPDANNSRIQLGRGGVSGLMSFELRARLCDTRTFDASQLCRQRLKLKISQSCFRTSQFLGHRLQTRATVEDGTAGLSRAHAFRFWARASWCHRSTDCVLRDSSESMRPQVVRRWVYKSNAPFFCREFC